MSEKTRVTLQLIFFIMFGNMFLNAYVLLNDMPNKWYVIFALVVLYITSLATIIWISSQEQSSQLSQPIFKEDTEIVIEIPSDDEKPVVKIENAFNDEPVVVTHVVEEDDTFVRVKSNGRKYSKLRGHGSKRTRARQPWIGARKADRVVNFDIESNGHWLTAGITGGGRTRDLLYLAAMMERLKEKGIEWKL